LQSAQIYIQIQRIELTAAPDKPNTWHPFYYNKMGRVVHCRSRRAILIKAYYSVASPFPQAKVPRLLAGRRRGAYLVSLTDFSADSHFFITFARLVRCLIYPGFSR
jgi:hypothetical protein